MIIGLDLGGMSAKAALFDGEKIISRAQGATSGAESAEQTIALLARLCRECGNFEKVEGIGVGAPGVIDSRSGTVVAWTNFGWQNVPLTKILGELTGKRVFLLNDANAAALGEATFGAGRDFESSILITLGTGVGGGVVLGGELFEGYKSAGGEVGHMVIKAGGRRCNCGRRGCLECYVSTRALLQDVARACKKFPSSALNASVKERGLDGKTLFFALKAGDAAAKEVFSAYISALGEGILNLANLFRPQAVLIGGGISAQGEELLAPLREYVQARLYLGDYAPMRISAATLQNDAGVFGAAEYARRRLIK